MKGGFFQIILLIIFIAGAIFGVLVFSGTIKLGEDSDEVAGQVVMWGTTRSADMAPLLEEFNNVNKTIRISYVEKSAENFDQELLEALASGVGPDLFMLPDDLAIHYANKIFPVPYTSYPLATYKNTFAGAGEVFLTTGGILAFPLSIDPLMLYYNRSMLDSNNVVFPPKTWGELAAVAPKLTARDTTGKIIKSGVALGLYSNIAHAKDILAAMFLQTGNPILGSGVAGLRSTLDDSTNGRDLSSTLGYYVSFADPSKPVYSWNKSFPNSTDSFSSEDTALYFGFASELKTLFSKNPNQNIGVTNIPQIDGSFAKGTNGHVTGIAISAQSKNIPLAFATASLLATKDFAGQYARAVAVPPARRDLLNTIPADAYSPIFYDSALYAKSWLDPSSKDTDAIFAFMIENMLANNLLVQDVLSDAASKMNLLLVK